MEGDLQADIEHLYRIERFLGSMSDLNSLLTAIMSEAAAAVDAESASLALYDEVTNELYFYVAKGGEEERDFERKLTQFRLPMGTGVLGWCAEHRQVANISDAYDDLRFDSEVDKETGFRTRSILAVPMIRREKLIGVVEAVNRRNHEPFSPRQEKVLSFLAAQAALIIENARLYQENLRQAKLTALGQGVAGAAHCNKNILNGIDGGSYILELGLKRQKLENISKGWDILKRNSGIMKALVMDMLAYSRPRKPEYAPTDINKVCVDVADLMREKAKEKNVAVNVDLDESIGELVLDPKGLFRCILNLVSNAVDACDKDEGVVGIITRRPRPENELTIAISDNGCGISPENQKSLFKVFFSTKGSKGTGLGLAVTQKIIQEHGGDIAVESELGRGTSFVIGLPAKPAGAQAGNPG